MFIQLLVSLLHPCQFLLLTCNLDVSLAHRVLSMNNLNTQKKKSHGKPDNNNQRTLFTLLA